MPEPDIHERGDGALPPPWYRPPADVTKGPMRTRTSIIAGLVIRNDEARRWYYENYKVQLSNNRDVNVIVKLRRLLSEKGIDAYDISFAPRRMDPYVSDFLIITQIDARLFTHDGPEGYEEVYDEDRKPIKGVRESNVEAQLLANFGITANEFKCYYSNRYG
ncbi:hypothetical protein H0H92_004760 [Tricholoma furcatifolium]|nr:hypothetical protein H0H92_004760 [Tricholoma furcatifolium]